MVWTPRVIVVLAAASTLGVLVNAAGVARAQVPGLRVDEHVQRQIELRRIPGLSVGVVHDGRVVLAKGYGTASLEFQVPATADTRYLLASLTKSFTALAVMMLVEEGKLGLDDPISRYLDDPPPAWERITVRHLLTHTAGLRNRFEGRTPSDWLLTFSKATLYGSAKTLPLDFTPGERWQYADQGYFLLGLVIERAAGKSYQAFVSDRIFKPLGMASTGVLSKLAVIPNLAPNYSRLGDAWIRSRERDADYAVGSHYGIVSTVNDLLKWNAALDAQALVGRHSYEQMWAPATLASGEVADSGLGAYGLGWFLDEFRGHRIVMHGGSTGTSVVRYPDDRLAVVVLGNLEGAAGMDADAMAQRIAGMVVPAVSWDTMKPAVDLDPATTHTIKADLDRLVAGKPDMTRYEPDAEPYARAAARSFTAAGGPRAFTNLKIAFLERGQQSGRRVFYYLATSDAAAMYLRVTLAADGRISRLQITQQ